MSPVVRARTWPATFALLAMTVGGGFALGYYVASRKPPAPEPQAARARPAPATPRVRLPDGLRQHAGVRTEALRSGSLAPTLELGGTVEFEPDRVADIGGRIAGRVSRVFVRQGAVVRAGEPLVTVSSPTLGELLSTSLSARAQLVAARAQVVRLSTLAQQQLATAVELDEARARVASLGAELRGVEQRLVAMGARPGDLGNASIGVTLRSPIAGRVVERNASVGQVIDPTHTMIRVADLSRVLVMLRVFERDVARIAVGDPVSIRAETHADRVFAGTVARVDATVDRETRTARVEVAIDNLEELLRPGQFATARIELRGGAREGMTIPRSAIVLLEGQPTIFVEVEPWVFEPRPIATRGGDSDRVELLRGANEGERVAVEGVFALKSELQR
ncbi:MAG: efflux RND transporter periplasmic adaptor subunit [Myxococcales bacterium]|nr:efflux RND transporter periplasmic adaptor subunit [Myxococcales bacterium]